MWERGEEKNNLVVERERDKEESHHSIRLNIAFDMSHQILFTRESPLTIIFQAIAQLV